MTLAVPRTSYTFRPWGDMNDDFTKNTCIVKAGFLSYGFGSVEKVVNFAEKTNFSNDFTARSTICWQLFYFALIGPTFCRKALF